MTRIPGAIGVAVAILALASPAHAGLTICNKTSYRMQAAIGYFPKDAAGTSTGGDAGGTVHGWRVIEAGACDLVDRNVANRGWFYVYAETLPSGRLSIQGSARLCVRDQPFDEQQLFLHGTEQCRRGYQSRGFNRIESSTVEFTYNLDLSG